MKIKTIIKKTWNFLIKEDSAASFIVDAILIVLIGKFILYPILGMIFSTAFPVVAVVSSSMDHQGLTFDDWWTQNQEQYQEFNITKAQFESFYLEKGFNKGDIFIVKGTDFNELEIGDIIVYRIPGQKDPIIHRIVLVEDTIQTKGDANPQQIHFEKSIQENQIYGKAILRIPYLGWAKVLLVEFLNWFR
jgi:signal peptidase I